MISFKGSEFQKRKADSVLNNITLPIKSAIVDLEHIVECDDCLPYLDHEELKRNLEMLKTVIENLKLKPENTTILPYEKGMLL